MDSWSFQRQPLGGDVGRVSNDARWIEWWGRSGGRDKRGKKLIENNS
jgi:hypothetical protein